MKAVHLMLVAGRRLTTDRPKEAGYRNHIGAGDRYVIRHAHRMPDLGPASKKWEVTVANCFPVDTCIIFRAGGV